MDVLAAIRDGANPPPGYSRPTQDVINEEVAKALKEIAMLLETLIPLNKVKDYNSKKLNSIHESIEKINNLRGKARS